MESLFSQVVIISIRKSVSSNVVLWCRGKTCSNRYRLYCIYDFIRIFFSWNVYFCTEVNLKENSVASFWVNWALPGIKVAALFAGGSSVVHPLHCVFTLWGTHCTEQRKVTPTLFFWGKLFASIDSSHTAQSTVCVLGGLLTQARKWSLVINKWASTSYWQSLGGSSSPCIMHLSASELGQSLINSRARPSPLPKFKEHRAS